MNDTTIAPTFVPTWHYDLKILLSWIHYSSVVKRLSTTLKLILGPEKCLIFILI